MPGAVTVGVQMSPEFSSIGDQIRKRLEQDFASLPQVGSDAGGQVGEQLGASISESLAGGLSGAPPAVQAYGQQIAASLTSSLVGAGQSIGAQLGTAMIEGVSPRVTEMFSDLPGVASNAVSQAAELIGSGLDALPGVVEELGAEAGNALKNKVIDGAGNAGREGGELLASRAGEMIDSGLSGMPPAVQEFGGRVGDTLSATLPAAGEQIGQALASKLVDAAAPVVAQGFSTGTQALRDLATGYRTAGASADGFGRGAGKAGVAAKTASIGTNLMAGAQKALNTVMRANPLGLIVTALGALAAGLVYAYENSETFREIVDTVFSFVREVAEEVMGFFTETLPGMWTALQEAAQDFWDALVGLIETAWEWIKTILAHHPFALLFTYWEEITAFIGEAWDWLVEKTGEVWDWLVEKITGVAESIVEFLTGVWDRVTGAVQAAWDRVVELIDAAWQVVLDTIRGAITWVVELVEGLRERIGAVFSAIRERLGGIVGGIATAISNAFENARKWAVEKFEALRTGVEDKVEAVLKFVGDLPGKIKGFFSDAKNFLLNAGKNIVRGLIDGIDALWQKVKDKLSGLTDLIPDWKGPARVDKKLLTPAGRMIMDGIDDRFPDLRGRLGDVSGEITKRVVPASLEVRDHAAGLGDTPFSKGGPVVNIERFEATEEMSPHEVGDRLMFLMRSRGM